MDRGRRALEAIARSGTRWPRLDPTPFSLHAWFLAWWDGYGAGRLRVITLWERELVALLPLCERGGRLEAMANEESCVVRPLALIR